MEFPTEFHHAQSAAKCFYGHFVEYGTKKMSAKLFMRPAVQRAKGYMKEVLESHISAMNAQLGAS